MSTKLNSIFNELKLNEKNGLYINKEFHAKELPEYPSRIKIPLHSIKFDAIYNVDNTPLILFKEFDRLDDNIEKEIESLHKDIWNLNEIPILFIVLPTQIRIYNGFVFDKNRNQAWKTITVENENEKNEFNYINIISGNFWKTHKNRFNQGKEYMIIF